MGVQPIELRGSGWGTCVIVPRDLPPDDVTLLC